jgi:hypothetical protein
MVNELFDDKDVAGTGKDNEPAIPEEYKGKSTQELVQLIEEGKKTQAASTQRLQDVTEQVLENQKREQAAKDEAARAEAARGTEEASFYTDPEKAASDLFDKKMAPLKQTFLNQQQVTQLGEVGKLEFFDHFKDKIQAIVNATAPEVRAQPGFLKSVYDLVVGQNYEEAKTLQLEKKKKEPEFTESTGSGHAPSTKKVTLTPEEEEVAEGLGMTAEKYIAWKSDPTTARAEARKN